MSEHSTPAVLAVLCGVTGPDRDVDRMINTWACARATPEILAGPVGRRLLEETPHYTGDVGLALMFLEAFLPPKINYLVGRGRLSTGEASFGAMIFPPGDVIDEDADSIGEGEHETSLACAILIATFGTLADGRVSIQ